MVSAQHDSPWKLVLLVLVLAFFACVGIAHIVKPDWFVKRSGVPKGGEMLTEWNRLQFRLGGAVFAAFAVYLLFLLARDYFAR
jgi:hypothetical protein